jgi:hypothetical protein
MDTTKCKPGHILKILRGKTGVVVAERLEGKPDVLIALEAPDRERLLKLTGDALSSVEQYIDYINVLPVKDGRA